MKIALIGSMGSGKSVARTGFARAGLPVYDFDELLRAASERDDYRSEIARVFGDRFVNESGIERQKLGEYVFADAERTARLNAVTDRFVRAIFRDLCARHENFAAEVSVYRGSALEGAFDCVVGVVCPDRARKIERLRARSGYALEYIENVWRRQPTDEEVRRLSDRILINDGSTEALIGRAEALVRDLTQGKDCGKLR